MNRLGDIVSRAAAGRFYMLLTYRVLAAVSAGWAACNVSNAHGQNYPARPVRIVAGAAGGGADFVARLIAHGVSVPLGQQIIVDNRGGATIPGEIVARAPADGHTLLVLGGTFWLAPFLRDHVGYDPQRDFAPVTLAVSSPNIIVVHPTLPVTTVKELIALCKARPRAFNYGAAGGASSHLAAESFKAMAGIDVIYIPYKGTGPALNDVIAGQVQLMFPNASSVTPHVKSGRLRALAVTSREPSILAPGLPTAAATLPGYDSVSVIGVFAPAGTPPAIIRRLNQETVRFLRTPEAKERLLNGGAEAVGSSPEELDTTVKSEMSRLGKVIRDAGIRAE